MGDENQKSQLSVKPANLQQIFDVYLKTKAKAGTSSSAAPAAAAPETPASAEVRANSCG